MERTRSPTLADGATVNNPQGNILLFDIETAPARAYVWGLFKQNISISQVISSPYVLCWAAKWLGGDEVYWDALNRHDLFKEDKADDSIVVDSMREMLDQADVVIAQNGDRFDIPMINAHCLKNDLPPVSPFKSVDTLKIAKQSMRFLSNKLDYMAQFLYGDRKEKTDFDLWIGCMEGDKKSWDQMVSYNIKDVELLEDVYLALRPWARTHPNMALLVDDEDPMCPRCQSKNLKCNGTRVVRTMAGRYRQFYCRDCGYYPRGRKNLNTKEKQASLLASSL